MTSQNELVGNQERGYDG